MSHAHALKKPIIPAKEGGVKLQNGLFGDILYISLSNRLACVVTIVQTMGQRQIRRFKLDPESNQLTRDLRQWYLTPGFQIRYRIQDETGQESEPRDGRPELFEMGLYVNVTDIPRKALIEVDGLLNDARQFHFRLGQRRCSPGKGVLMRPACRLILRFNNHSISKVTIGGVGLSGSKGQTEKLDKVDFVEWRLHPNISQPNSRMSDRGMKFRLETCGWGNVPCNWHGSIHGWLTAQAAA